MGQTFFYLIAAIVYSFCFFLTLFLGSNLVIKKQKTVKNWLLPIFTSFYIFSLIFILLKETHSFVLNEIFTKQTILAFMIFTCLYIILFHFIYFDKKKIGTLKNFLICIGLVGFAVVVAQLLYFPYLSENNIDYMNLTLSSILFLVLVFLSIRLIQLIYHDIMFNRKNPPLRIILASSFFSSISIVFGILEVIQSSVGKIDYLFVNIEVISILLLLVMIAIYSEKQYYEKQSQWLRTKKHLRFQAYHDPLTRLVNRREIYETMESWINKKTPFAIYFVDLDHFKNVNDLLGHDVGDELLIQIGQRMTELTNDSDHVGRIGGDEFIILKSRLTEEEISSFAQRIIDQITLPIYLFEQEMIVTSSLGVAYFPKDGSSAIELLKRADIAMYQSKHSGHNQFYIYEKQLDEQIIRSFKLKEDLKFALKKAQLFLHYQPKVEISSRKINGFEALLRWHHPELGSIPPSEFIPLAEETGMIIEIDSWVLEKACEDIIKMNKQLGTCYKIAVNFSVKQLIQKNIVDTIKEVLFETKMPPHLLELEITETVAMGDLQAATKTVKKIQELGVHLSIDDYGTGYNSLSNLHELRIQRLKIDRSFIKDVVHNPQSETIVKTIVAMASHLGLSITAEGVETLEQLDFLKDIGCEEAQGFYFSKPKPWHEMIESIQSKDKLYKA
ncbi:putative bifunctional diguanylate cyclase/phosphodiesterase [Cytobacillus sp. Hz8]|uniref:putative bifunctional diguanylate cyclase/phosphodiesterase n=1 Tax=Cytobacillus sp. Hz8 TaxID=3347168 RepID=UPI0035D5CAFC